MNKKLITTFSASLAQNWMSSIALVATDMDGTITTAGKFESRLFLQLEALKAQGISVLIVTGRSAGWVSALVEYLPVAGAIAENGGYFFTPDLMAGMPLIQIDPTFRQRLGQVFHDLKTNYPHISPSADNQFRMTDWTFDRGDLPPETLAKMQSQCQALGWGFTYSSIQCHIKSPHQSKQSGLLKALDALYSGAVQSHQVLTMGDSPNDADLLDASIFPYSVGVANLKPYLPTLSLSPRWLSSKAELDGFLEVTNALLSCQRGAQ